MINNTDKRYKIQVTVSGNTLTYNLCQILNEDDTWLEFFDKFRKKFKINKRNIVILEEVEDGN